MESISSFSTADFPPEQRLDAWREHIRGSIFQATIQSFNPDGLRASNVVRNLGPISLHHMTCNEHIVERTPDDARVNPVNVIFFTTVLTGRSVFYSANNAEVLDPGEVLVYDPEQPYVMGFQPNSSQVFIEVPRDYFKKELGFPFPRGTRKAEISLSGLGELGLASLVRLAEDVGDPTVSDVSISERVRLLIDVTIQLSYGGESGEVLRRAREAIARLYIQPTIQSADIALEISVSLRHLDRLFALRGTTTAKQITSARLTHARRLLIESDQPVAYIAAECGFGSSETLNRQFKSVFGVLPSAFRASVRREDYFR